MATAPPAGSIPIATIPAISNHAPTCNGPNTGRTNNGVAVSQGIGQNVPAAQGATLATTTTSKRGWGYLSVLSILQTVGSLLAVAFGTIGVWYMYRTDKIQVWTTKKDEREYCEGLKDITLAPQCLNILATPLEPRPYMTMLKRWSPSFVHEGNSSSSSWFSLRGPLAIIIFVLVLGLSISVKIFLAHSRIRAAGLTASEASILAERLLDEFYRAQDKAPDRLSIDMKTSKVSRIQASVSTPLEAPILAEDLIAQASRAHKEKVAQSFSANQESNLRRRFQGRPENGNHSDSSSSSMFSSVSVASYDFQDNDFVTAILTVAEILVSDPFVKELCGLAIAKMNESRFQRNFARLLGRYAMDLKVEATSKLHLQGIRLIRMSRKRIAYTILDMLHQIIPSSQHEAEARSLQKGRIERFLKEQTPRSSSQSEHQAVSTRLARLEEFLKSHGPLNLSEITTRVRIPIANDDTDSDEFKIELDGTGMYGLDAAAIQDVTKFLTTTQAFWNLRDNFRKFLFPEAWTIYQEGMRSIVTHRSPKMITYGGYEDHSVPDKVKMG